MHDVVNTGQCTLLYRCGICGIYGSTFGKDP